MKEKGTHRFGRFREELSRKAFSGFFDSRFSRLIRLLATVKRYRLLAEEIILSIFRRLLSSRSHSMAGRLRVAGILFLVFIPVAVYSNTVLYHSLPDSARLQIRLTSFVLMRPQQELPVSLFSPGTDVPVAFLFDGSHQAELIDKIKRCSRYQSWIPIITKSGLKVPDDAGAGIFIYNPDELDSLVCTRDTTSQPGCNVRLGKNELLKVTISDTACQDACFNLWKKTGKLPNFIESDPSGMDEALRVVSFFNDAGKIYGVTLEDGKLLTEVFWENSPGVKTYGYFSFPLQGADRHLIPYKAGYRFSPGIIVQSTSNWNAMKIFRGIKHEPDFGLENHFTFHEKIRNRKWENSDGIINYGVKFRKDRNMGGVACFEDHAYFDAGPQSAGILSSNFSIIAWVNHHNPTGKNGILGKGRNFNLGIYEGNLTFSMVSVRDYISEKSFVPPNSWTQVAMVYSQFNNQISFYLNGEQTDQIDLISNYEGSGHSLLIGNNLWEEFFNGGMGEIKIWERELNQEEIHRQYVNSAPERSSFLKASLLALIFLVMVATGAFFIFRNRKRRKKHADSVKASRAGTMRTTAGRERIVCFGGLKVFNSADEDISLKFSPKLKQIFTLILLYSQEADKGITSKQLAEILWPGTSLASTKNLRSTYMQNLRSALSSFKKIKLVFSNKKWLFDYDGDFCDEYAEIGSILPELHQEKDMKVLEMQLPPVIAMLKKGPFLCGMEGSWLDPFVERLNNRVIEFCLAMFSALDHDRHSALLFDLAGIVSLADPLNEPALQKKISLLIRQGKLSLAKNIYDNFVKLYKELYQEDYDIDFKDLVIP